MIRSVAAFFLFAVFVCALIILRSGGASVDQAATAPLSDRPLAQDSPVVPEAEVTRADIAPMALPASSSRVAIPQDARVEVPPTIRTDTAVSMEDMTMNVLAELGLLPESQTTLPQQAEQRDVTQSAVAGIGAATGRTTGMGERNDLQSLVVAALRAGEDDATIDMLINEAAIAHEVAVPEVLVTSDGRVDTAVLLAEIVTQAKVASGQIAPPTRPDQIADTQGLEVRLVQAVQGQTEARFYTVQPGDSLGAIAIKFYGDVNDYPRIFEANRQVLNSPDLIRSGQRLVIPEI